MATRLLQGPLSNLVKRLLDLGIDRKAIEKICEQIKKLWTAAEIKTDANDCEDQARPMRRLELKLLELNEWRQSLVESATPAEAEEVRRQEHKLEKERTLLRQQAFVEAEVNARIEKQKELERKQLRNAGLVDRIPCRKAMHVSVKAATNDQQEEKRVIPQSDLDNLKYLEMLLPPDSTTSGLNTQQSSDF